MKLNKNEKFVQVPDKGIRIEGREVVNDHLYTWMRYVPNTKTMDDLKRD